jgi:hypothetical protein
MGFHNIDDIQELEEYDDDDKKKPKIMVFDDFINVENKKLKNN